MSLSSASNTEFRTGGQAVRNVHFVRSSVVLNVRSGLASRRVFAPMCSHAICLLDVSPCAFTNSVLYSYVHLNRVFTTQVAKSLKQQTTCVTSGTSIQAQSYTAVKWWYIFFHHTGIRSVLSIGRYTKFSIRFRKKKWYLSNCSHVSYIWKNEINKRQISMSFEHPRVQIINTFTCHCPLCHHVLSV